MVDCGRSEDAFVLVVIPLPTQGNNFFELECIVSDVNQGGDGEAPPHDIVWFLLIPIGWTSVKFW